MTVSHLFPKGKSGNPGGMSSEYQQLVKDFKHECAREAYKRLPLLLRLIDSEDTPPNVRVSAVNSLLDRGFGKAVQSLLIDDAKTDKAPSMMNKSELDAYLAGDVITTVVSMFERGDKSLLEALNNATQQVAQNNPADS